MYRCFLVPGQAGICMDMDTGLFQFRQDVFMPAGVLGSKIRKESFMDYVELLCRSHSVGWCFQNALEELALEAGDANHEEFIKITGKYGKEFHSFKQGVGWIERLVKNMAVEPDPAEFAVDI